VKKQIDIMSTFQSVSDSWKICCHCTVNLKMKIW